MPGSCIRTLASERERKALADEFKRVCGPDEANVIYDGVGGNYSEVALRALGGMVVGFPAGIRIGGNFRAIRAHARESAR